MASAGRYRAARRRHRERNSADRGRGLRRFEDIARAQALGAAAVQLGTPFAVTQECDAHAAFKRVLAQAREEDRVEFMSVAGLPARAVSTPWLKHYLKAEPKLQGVAHVKPRCTLAFDCLIQCGLRDGLPGWGQFCIDTQLAAALRGMSRKVCSSALPVYCRSAIRSAAYAS